MNDLFLLPTALRDRLRPMLPDHAFLRRDRGDALFVTNAPAFADGPELGRTLSAVGFLCSLHGGIMTVSPGAEFLRAVEGTASPDDFLCLSLERFRGCKPCEEALSLFALGVRLLEHAEPNDYSRRVRQLAAVCLREDLGGVYGCALIDLALRHRKELLP